MHDFETIFLEGRIFLQLKSACNRFEKRFILVILHSKYMNEYKSKKVVLETLTYAYEKFTKFRTTIELY